jgi:hypothetical protein
MGTIIQTLPGKATVRGRAMRGLDGGCDFIVKSDSTELYFGLA